MEKNSMFLKVILTIIAVLSTGASGISAWVLLKTQDHNVRIGIIESTKPAETVKDANELRVRVSVIESRCMEMHDDIKEIKADVKTILSNQ